MQAKPQQLSLPESQNGEGRELLLQSGLPCMVVQAVNCTKVLGQEGKWKWKSILCSAPQTLCSGTGLSLPG